jgi:hypothetical protein
MSTSRLLTWLTAFFDLLSIGHVEHQRRHALIGDVDGSASSCVHPLGAAPEGFLGEVRKSLENIPTNGYAKAQSDDT